MPPRPVFSIRDLLQASNELRTIGLGAPSREETASAIVSFLRDRFVDKESGLSVLPLVRFYVTQPYGELDASLQDFAQAAGSDASIGPAVTCLTLLASAGEEPAWNDRRASVGHKAIPLPSLQTLRRSPMIAQLIEQIGLDPQRVIEPDPSLFRDLSERTYSVFYVPEALDSPYVPAQNNFVIPYGIRSVVGFGGILPDGTLFAVVMFASVSIPRATLDAFAALGLGARITLLSNEADKIFASSPPVQRSPEAAEALRWDWLEARATALSQLLDLRGEIVNHFAAGLEQQAVRAADRAASLEASQAALKLAEARNRAIVEGALDAIIGMDSTGRITDFNHAAEKMFGFTSEEAIGEPLADIIIPYSMRERHRLGLANLLATGSGPVIGRRIEVSGLRRDATEFPIELTVTAVPHVDPPLFSGYVRDISAGRAAAAELQAGQERLAHIARTLQTSLLPSVLPEISGVELAAAFDAFGDGYEVGGDFYDVFALDDGRWALALGDVCGKGSDAAALTALARYTLRAAGTHEDDPAGVLGALNEAIYRQHPEQFCTAIYATIDPSTGALALALGGHPQPLVLRANGEVAAIGTPNLLLGPFEEWQGSPGRYILEPGETLFLYSDGVTEARSHAEFFGEERLIATIGSAFGLPVHAAVQLIESTVLAFAGKLSDDLAILAVQRAR